MEKHIYYFFRRLFDFFLSLMLRLFKADTRQCSVLIVLANKIGDFILFSPSLKYIKQAYPGCSLAIATDKNVEALAGSFPEIDEFIPIDIKKFQLNPFYAAKIFWRIRMRRFLIALYPVYSRSFTGDELVRMSGAKDRIGFLGDDSNIDRKNRIHNNRWYTKLLKPKLDFPKGFLEIKRYRYFCEQIGAKVVDDFVPRILLSPKDRAGGIEILKRNGWNGERYVVVTPGAGLRYRSWPTNKFALVVQYFVDHGFVVVFAGSKGENDLFDAISKNVVGGTLINLMGKTSLPHLGGVLSGSVLYFGSDTGTVHLAAAVGTPTVCLLGGGYFDRFFPYGDLKKNRIVYDKNMKCKYDAWACARRVPFGQSAPCIGGITVEDAIGEIKNLI